jgi:senataxin
LNSFYDMFEGWERTRLLQDLKKFGFGNEPTSVTAQTVAELQPAIVYRMLSNWTIFKDPVVFSILHATPPAQHLFEWPRDPPPPGLLILLMDNKPEVRRWAETYAAKATVIPISSDDFIGPFPKILEVIGHHLSDPTPNPDLPFSFASNQHDLWSGFRMVLRQIPPNVLGLPSRQHSDFRGIIIRHLSDTGPR